MLADPGSNGNAIGRSLKAAGSTAPAISIWRGVPEHRQPRRDGAVIQSFFVPGRPAGLAKARVYRRAITQRITPPRSVAYASIERPFWARMAATASAWP